MATRDTDTQSGPPSGSEPGSLFTNHSLSLFREPLTSTIGRGRAVVRQQDFARHKRVSEAPILRKLSAKGARSWTWLGPFSKSVLLGVIRSSPGTLIWPLAVLITCTALGLFGIFAASDDAVHAERGVATELASDAARRIELQIQQAFTPTIAVEMFIQQEHHFPTLMRSFPSISTQLLARVRNNSISNLQLAPNMVVQAVAPLVGNERVIGMDLLTGDPERVADVLWTITSRNLTVAGPYKLVQGGFGVIIRQPVFVHNVSEDETFGAVVSSQPCPECWDPATRTKLWGFAQGMARLDGLLQGSDNRLRALQKYGPWHIARLLPNGTEKNIACRSPSGSCEDGACGDCVKVDILLPNARWRLYLNKDGGWEPHWQAGLVALVVVGSFLLATLLFCLLVAAERHKALLTAMFPAKVLRPLQQGKNFSEEFDSVTILFSDIVSYTIISSVLQPIEVAQMLNELYCEFDDLVDKNGCYKIETIGDAFMAVGGCPVAEPPEVAAERVAMMALDMVRRAEQFQSSAGHRLRIRVGLASGPVAAAVIGRKMPRYCLFGDTVNLASRMESTSEPMRIQVATSTAQLLQRCASAASLTLIPRGPVNVKGKGYIECFWLEALASAEQRGLCPMPPPRDGAPERALARMYGAAMSMMHLTLSQPNAVAEPVAAAAGSQPCRACACNGDSRRLQGQPQLSRLGDGGGGGGSPSAVLNGLHQSFCSCGSAVMPVELRWTSRHLPGMYDSGRSSLPGLQPAMSGNGGAGGCGGSSPQLPLSLSALPAAATSAGEPACRDSGRFWTDVLATRSSRLSSTGGACRSGSILRSLLRAGAVGAGQGGVGGAADGGASVDAAATAPSLLTASRHDLSQLGRSAQSLSRYELRRLGRPAPSGTTGPGATGAEATRVLTAPIAHDGGSLATVAVATSALAAAFRAATPEARVEGGAGPGPNAAGTAAESCVASPSIHLELATQGPGPPDRPSTLRGWPRPSNLMLTTEELTYTTGPPSP